MNKFKIGDKVKIIRTCRGNWCRQFNCKFLNKIGTVCEINSDQCVGVNNFEGTYGWWCSGFDSDCLELVRAFKKKIEPYGLVKWLEKYAYLGQKTSI